MSGTARNRRAMRAIGAMIGLWVGAAAFGGATARPTTLPSTRPAVWGIPIQGVSAALMPDRTRWYAGETPTARLSVRNEGKRQLLVGQSQETCEIELDGRWYRWVADADVKTADLGPGVQHDGIPIALVDGWSLVDGHGRLNLTPGGHMLRVAALPDSLELFEAAVRAISNPVRFEISAPPATTRAAVPPGAR
jgi:hypothetical protein